MLAKTLVSVLCGLVVMAGSGCSLLGVGRDGDSCSDSRDCESETCANGTCAGSDCSEDEDVCRHGWLCTHESADFVSSAFGAHGSDRCEATCGSCPDNTYCPADGKEGDTRCIAGTKP